jgi:glucosamine kinase
VHPAAAFAIDGRRAARVTGSGSGAAAQIDELVRRLIECGAPRVALIGGLASSMEPWLAPDVQRRLSPVEGDAVAGALHLARRRAVMARAC